MYNTQDIIGDEFLTGLLDVLEEYDNKATTDAEHKLMYELVLKLNDTIDFTNDDPE